jgi:hypothetical protein
VIWIAERDAVRVRQQNPFKLTQIRHILGGFELLLPCRFLPWDFLGVLSFKVCGEHFLTENASLHQEQWLGKIAVDFDLAAPLMT